MTLTTAASGFECLRQLKCGRSAHYVCGGGTTGTTTRQSWLDCDYNSAPCSLCNSATGQTLAFVVSGDDSIGEYGSGTDGGDGTGENYDLGVGGAACCSLSNDCYIGSVCVADEGDRTYGSYDYCCRNGNVDSNIDLGATVTCAAGTCGSGSILYNGVCYSGIFCDHIDGWDYGSSAACTNGASSATCYYGASCSGSGCSRTADTTLSYPSGQIGICGATCASGYLVVGTQCWPGVSCSSSSGWWTNEGFQTMYPLGTRRNFNADCAIAASTCSSGGAVTNWRTCSSSYLGNTCGSYTCFYDPALGSWVWDTPRANGALCDYSQGCSSGVCASWRTNYMGTGRTTVQSSYRCAPSTSYCVDDISPYYHASGSTTWSSNHLLCDGNYIFRCSTSVDQCNDAPCSSCDTEYYASGSVQGLECYCTASNSCTWSSAVPLERSASNNCNDDIDNDCDNLCDFTPSGCPAGTAEGADCQSCTGAGGIGCYTSRPTGWSQVTAGTPYCNAVSGSTYECYGCSSGWTYIGGTCCIDLGDSCSSDTQCCYYDGTHNGDWCDGGVCQHTTSCSPVCWNNFCISGGHACCQTTCGTTNVVCYDDGFSVTPY